VKNYSGHIIFEDNFQWKDLEKYFPDIWGIVEGESKLNPEDKQFDDILLELNMEEIRKNKKPFGYRRENTRFKMIFPQDKKELTIYRNIISEEIEELTEKVAHEIKNKKIKYSIKYDQMLSIKLKKK
jgi:Cft2 family RNA processing exonuclease